MVTHKVLQWGCLSYPVGPNIMTNINRIKEMGEKISALINKRYKSKNRVILLCRGSSGAILSALVSDIIIEKTGKGVEIYHIKKEGESSHGGNYIPTDSFYHCVTVVIDDFIQTGTTIKSIVDKVNSCGAQIINILCVSGTIDLPLEYKSKFQHGICSKKKC